MLLFFRHSALCPGAATPTPLFPDDYRAASERGEEYEFMIRYVPGCETRKRLDGIAFPCEFRIDVRPC